jgi:hypothetical protein
MTASLVGWRKYLQASVAKRYQPAVCAGLAAFAMLAFHPTTASAQSRIAGVVKDTSGAVLPGVTVEAASPALIEKVRTVVSDSQGAYEIVDLRPGTYAVTFTLTGFSTVKREGIDLPAGFTATVNAEMRVGQVEETVTVTGEAPAVDAREAARELTVGQVEMSTLPIPTRDPSAYVATIPGATGIVLGGLGYTAKPVAIHGSNGAEVYYTLDGFGTEHSGAVGGGGTVYYMTQAYIQEVAVVTDASDAEQRMSAMAVNVIPKEGGNRFTGYLYSSLTTQGMVSNNITPALQAENVAAAGIRKSWDFTPAGGGPIIKDKLWFYNAWRASGIETFEPGLYVNSTPKGWAYTPVLSEPAWIEEKFGSGDIRLTWQASPRNKISAFTDWEPMTYMNRGFTSLTSLEATAYSPAEPNQWSEVRWSSPVTNRLFLEAGGTYYDLKYNPQRDLCGCNGGQADLEGPQDFTTVSKTEMSTGIIFGAPSPAAATAWGVNKYPEQSVKASASYVTGTHNFKTGFTDVWGSSYINTNLNGNYSVNLLNGLPNSLTEWEQPNGRTSNIKANLGIFAKDDWTIKRLTLNLGVRYDYFDAYTPPQTLAAGFYEGAQQFAGINNVIDYKDVSPRFSAAYDLFGDGKTAVKGFFGKFLVGLALNQVNPYNPVNTSVLSATRQWTDPTPIDGNFIPNCNLTDPLANGQCGQINNLAFGQENPNATITNPALTHGWGVRDFYWNESIQVDHQLRQGISVSAGYFRSSLTTHSATQNLDTTPADYSPYCITAPLNPGLPGGGGYPVCGLYDVNPQFFGKTQNYNTFATQFGFQPTQVYNGIDVTTTMHLPGNGRLTGGVSDGRTETDNCFVVNSPEGTGALGSLSAYPPTPGASSTGGLLYCNVKSPFQPNVRFSGNYPLWWGFDIGAVYANLPGAPITASYSATNAQIAPSLGRNLAEGATALISVPLIAPGTDFGPRQQQMDLRVNKRFKIGKTLVTPSLEIQNLFNTAAISSYNTTYGTTGKTWLVPAAIQNPRFLALHVEMNF